MISDTEQRQFQAAVWDYYHDHGRKLPWRQPEPGGSFDPYKILVSEVMLQQTQVARVIPKYREFLERFPTIQALANAQLGDILRAWSGLGYNRRAKFLYQAAGVVVSSYAGKFPQTIADLVKLPGVGSNTAGAIMAYAFNQPAVFVETNIRTVFIHHFLYDQTDIHDKEIVKLVKQTLDNEHPREWYWALMDYGSYLKQTIGNLNYHSKTYMKQSTFHGSRRQLRGQVLRLLHEKPLPEAVLANHIGDERLDSVIQELLKEGMISRQGPKLAL